MTIEFGRVLTSYIKASGLTQTEVARRAKVDHGYLSKVSRGTRNTSIDTAVHLADVLNIPSDYRAEFLLLSVGFSAETVRNAVEKSGLRTRDISHTLAVYHDNIEVFKAEYTSKK